MAAPAHRILWQDSGRTDTTTMNSNNTEITDLNVVAPPPCLVLKWSLTISSVHHCGSAMNADKTLLGSTQPVHRLNNILKNWKPCRCSKQKIECYRTDVHTNSLRNRNIPLAPRLSNQPYPELSNDYASMSTVAFLSTWPSTGSMQEERTITTTLTTSQCCWVVKSSSFCEGEKVQLHQDRHCRKFCRNSTSSIFLK